MSGTLKWLGRAAMIVAIFVVGMAVAVAIWAAPDRPGAFYATPKEVPARPGSLLRSEPYKAGVPQGVRAWRILYTTTRPSGAPAIASAVVATRVSGAAGPRPVIAWAHGTTGVVAGCAPSVTGDAFARVPALDAVFDNGWVFVATDYAGLGTAGGHAYLVGDDAARSVLDAVRAARAIEGLSLDNRVVAWGHSQGGASALWTGIAAGSYAPDVNLVGVAALAPGTDLPALIEATKTHPLGKVLTAYVTRAFDAAYPDTQAWTYVHPKARRIARDVSGRCIVGLEALATVMEAGLLPKEGIFQRPASEGPFGERLRQNIPTGPIAAPVLIAQGRDDDLVMERTQAAYVASRCAAGQAVDYRVHDGRDHMSVLDDPMAGELVAWTKDRFAGAPSRSTCPAR